MARIVFEPRKCGLWVTSETYLQRKYKRLSDLALAGDLRARESAQMLLEVHPELDQRG